MSTFTSYEWRVFGEISTRVRESIEALPSRFEGGGVKLSDEYVWRRGCLVNAKVRDQTLKFKALEHQEPDGVEIWSVLDRVVINASGVARLEDVLETKAPEALVSSCDSADDLMKALSEFNPPLDCIRVEKFRTQYLWTVGEHEVSVELAEIREPVRTTSICVEVATAAATGTSPDHSIFEALRSVYQELGLPGEMQVKSYLDALAEWAD